MHGPHSNAPLIAWWLITGTAVACAFAGLVWSIVMIQAYRRDLRRVRQGLCMQCGYDLRQSQGRCPECGETIRNFTAPPRRGGAKQNK
jgi:tRNA(Ile2) C34 agmatinyltransferase TiaS